MNIMAPGTLVIRVPELLEERGWNPMDLVRRANLATGTAYRLANGEADAITMEVLGRLCVAFGVDVGEIIARNPDKASN